MKTISDLLSVAAASMLLFAIVMFLFASRAETMSRERSLECYGFSLLGACAAFALTGLCAFYGAQP